MRGSLDEIFWGRAGLSKSDSIPLQRLPWFLFLVICPLIFVLGSWSLVLGPWFLVLGSGFVVLDPWFLGHKWTKGANMGHTFGA